MILTKMTIVPMVILCIVAAIISATAISASMASEVRNELVRLTELSLASMDNIYPGDFTYETKEDGMLVSKGDDVLNGNADFLDLIKETSGVECTLFIGNTRLLTTIHDTDGERITGTVLNTKIEKAVYASEAGVFYRNVDIYGESYYCYYEPVINSDGTIVGIFACCKPSADVRKLIIKAILPVLIADLVVLVLTYFYAAGYAKRFAGLVRQLRQSLEKSAEGQFSNTVPASLLSRKDEFGDIAHSIVDMQTSLRDLVETDQLTGLSNRRFGRQRLLHLMEKMQGGQGTPSLALGDIDFFKKFNDTYGHNCGDEVLVEISKLLQDHVKEHGYAIRWGGEEFLLVLSQGSFEDHKLLMEQLIRDIAAMECHYQEETIHLTMTFGLAHLDAGSSIEENMKRVDALLYQGKEGGRNRLVSES